MPSVNRIISLLFGVFTHHPCPPDHYRPDPMWIGCSFSKPLVAFGSAAYTCMDIHAENVDAHPSAMDIPETPSHHTPRSMGGFPNIQMRDGRNNLCVFLPFVGYSYGNCV